MNLYQLPAIKRSDYIGIDAPSYAGCTTLADITLVGHADLIRPLAHGMITNVSKTRNGLRTTKMVITCQSANVTPSGYAQMRAGSPVTVQTPFEQFGASIIYDDRSPNGITRFYLSFGPHGKRIGY